MGSSRQVTSALVEQLHRVGRDGQKVPDISIASENLNVSEVYDSHCMTDAVDVIRERPTLVLVDRVLSIRARCALHRDLSLARLEA